MISMTVSEQGLEKILDYELMHQDSVSSVRILSVVNLRFSDRYCVLVDCDDRTAILLLLKT